MANVIEVKAILDFFTEQSDVRIQNVHINNNQPPSPSCLSFILQSNSVSFLPSTLPLQLDKSTNAWSSCRLVLFDHVLRYNMAIEL